MRDFPESRTGLAPAPWLEVADGDAPLLLIAPHGGRAGSAARATLNPKVNDLETAAITRELARRLGAHALINHGMDRNELDCNRLEQLAANAPWLLDVIADKVGRIADRHGHVTVLLIHGWNVIEPRVDLGLGLRQRDGNLRPPAGAHVSASDEFIHGPVHNLADRLRNGGIMASFGHRYPGGDLQNLLQAFTARHEQSSLAALRRLAAIASQGLIDALQLELSVALRLPGVFRARNLDAVTETFSGIRSGAATSAWLTIIRQPLLHPTATRKSPKPPPRPLIRAGIEFYDPAAHIGAMASFDFGPRGTGGRVMVLFGRRRVALHTAEGAVQYRDGRISLGPLALHASGNDGALEFRGPAVVVSDSTAYLSVERALALGFLDNEMEVSAVLHLETGPHRLETLLSDIVNAAAAGMTQGLSPSGHPPIANPPPAAFGKIRGHVTVNGFRREVDAVARVGFAFSGLGPHKFVERRMLWACFPGAERQTAVEARIVSLEGAKHHREARVARGAISSECEITQLDLETPSTSTPPARIAAQLATPTGAAMQLTGEPQSFMTLSRPGPGNTRIYTSLGFARYRLDGIDGAGMFEYSRRAGDSAKIETAPNDSETD
jgi:hypothetical protein